MNPRLRIAFALFLLTGGAIEGRTARATDPEKDPAVAKLLDDARDLIDAKKLPAAIEKCDQVIARFRKHYANQKEKIYCARTSAENLGYLLMAAAEADRGTAKKNGAITLSTTWSNAYFMKGYALLDLGRRADAKSAIEQAVELAPWNPQYLCELGSIYQLEKDWPKAKKAFELAEDQAALSPPDVKAAELARARRGLGYVFVELGQLEAAEKKYRQCLADDPTDKKAAQELEYVRGLRAKKK